MTCSYKNCKEQPKKKLFGGYRKMCSFHLCYFRDIMRKRAKEKVKQT